MRGTPTIPLSTFVSNHSLYPFVADERYRSKRRWSATPKRKWPTYSRTSIRRQRSLLKRPTRASLLPSPLRPDRSRTVQEEDLEQVRWHLRVRLEGEGLELRGMGRPLPLEREGHSGVERSDLPLLLPLHSEEEGVSHRPRDSEEHRVQEGLVRSREGVPRRARLDPLDSHRLPHPPHLALPLPLVLPLRPPRSVNRDSDPPQHQLSVPRPLLPPLVLLHPQHSGHQYLQLDSEHSPNQQR